MTATPDTTEHTELDDQLRETIEATLLEYLAPVSVADPIIEAIGDTLAAIRRHAAADALNEQADRLSRIARGYMKQAAQCDGTVKASLVLNSQQAHLCATRIRTAAQDVIAEGYEHTCGASWAATRTDPGYGCDNPVENEGDLCDRHDAGDEEDRWAE